MHDVGERVCASLCGGAQLTLVAGLAVGERLEGGQEEGAGLGVQPAPDADGAVVAGLGPQLACVEGGAFGLLDVDGSVGVQDSVQVLAQAVQGAGIVSAGLVQQVPLGVVTGGGVDVGGQGVDATPDLLGVLDRGLSGRERGRGVGVTVVQRAGQVQVGHGGAVPDQRGGLEPGQRGRRAHGQRRAAVVDLGEVRQPGALDLGDDADQVPVQGQQVTIPQQRQRPRGQSSGACSMIRT